MKKTITIYGLSTCPWCRKTKALFTSSGVPFDYVDYDQVRTLPIDTFETRLEAGALWVRLPEPG